MTTLQKNKKRFYTKDDFSDKEVYNEIKDAIREIRERNLKQLEEDSLISNIYETKKQQMKLRRMKNNEELKPKIVRERNFNELGEEDEEEGEIKKPSQEMEPQAVQENAPSINELAQHIRPITITRNKISELFKSRKFQDIIKGCFVRYKSQNSNSYMLALVVGLLEGQKEYLLNNIKTKTLLRLQQSTSQIIKLSMDHVSNQHPPGSLEISKWLQANRNKIPKERQFKEKLQQLNNLIHGKVSSQEIDRNLLKMAERVAEDKAQGTENLSELIFFMRGHIHDLTVTLEEIQGDKQKFAIKKEQKKTCDEILAKLITKQAQLKQQKTQKEKQDKEKKEKSKKYTDYIYENRKEDRIREVYHEKILQLSSYQGSIRIKDKLMQVHQAFDIDIAI